MGKPMTPRLRKATLVSATGVSIRQWWRDFPAAKAKISAPGRGPDYLKKIGITRIARSRKATLVSATGVSIRQWWRDFPAAKAKISAPGRGPDYLKKIGITRIA